MPRPISTPAARKSACVDFETYYDDEFSVVSLGIRKYMEHPMFDPYLVAIHGDGIEYVGEPDEFDWSLLNGYDILAHNAAFDEAIWQFHGKRRWAPKSQLGPWYCTADLSAFHGLGRSLKSAVKNCFGEELSKDVRNRMKGVRWSTLPEAEREEWKRYAGSDALWSYRLWQKLGAEWPESERALSDITRRMGWRGITLDMPLLDENQLILKNRADALLAQIPFVNENTTPAARKAFNDACTAAGVPPPTTRSQKSEEWTTWLETYGEKVPWAPAVAEYQRVNRMLKLYETLLLRVLSSGRFSFGKKYYGAHTGRWSGDAGFNMENLNRDALHGTDIRNVFMPADGHVMISSDLSQIEPRVLAWRAGETDFLDACRNGISPYVAHGLKTGRVSDPVAFEKAREEKGSPEKAAYSGLKAEVLLLGYGGGAATFMRSAAVYGIQPTLEEAEGIVAAFRAGRPLVVKLWRELERQWYTQRTLVGTGREIRLPLPSGRVLRYFHPRVTEREATAKTSLDDRVWGKLYGGKLTENWVQAVARDVLADMLLRIARYEWIVPLLTVHDEIVVEVPEYRAQEALEIIRKEMSTPPAWALDLPVACSAKIIPCYEK